MCLKQNSSFHSHTEKILFSKNIAENWLNLIHSIKSLTGFSRVMVYKFKEDGSGESIAEIVDDNFESYLNLRFPEFDVSKKSREIFLKKRNVLVTDVNQINHKIISNTKELIDLTYSEFRTVTENHVQFLKNLNVASSFTISIVINNRLWGLVSCHHHVPKHIPINLKLQCVTLTRMARVSFVNFKYEEKIIFSEKVNSLLVDLKETLLIENDFDKIIVNFKDTLALTKTDGVAIINQDMVYSYGDVPSKCEILKINKWAIDYNVVDLYVSNSFHRDQGVQLNIGNSAAGIVLKFLSEDNRSSIIWFKKEEESTINWAGNPYHFNYSLDNKIIPRTNFKLWKEVSYKESIAWKRTELDIIKSIISVILETNHKKAFKIAELYNDLKELNAELDSFSYTVSHDLRSPLAVMKLNCQMIQRTLERESSNYNKIKEVVLQIDNLANMMQEILHLSKAKKSEIVLQEIDCESLIHQVVLESKIYHNSPNTEVIIGKVYNVSSDKTMAYEIFLNIISNAIKYSAKAINPRVEIYSTLQNKRVTYHIIDNGIGIKEVDKEKMFKLFSRMSNTDGFKGNGIGLSIVYQMLQRLDGEISYKSEENVGTTFSITFKSA